MVSEARPVCQQISQFDEIRVSIGNVILVKVGLGVELVSKELNHLAAILHVYAGGLNFMK